MKLLYLALAALLIQSTIVSAETPGAKNSADKNAGIDSAHGEKSDPKQKYKEEAPPESQP